MAIKPASNNKTTPHNGFPNLVQDLPDINHPPWFTKFHGWPGAGKSLPDTPQHRDSSIAQAVKERNVKWFTSFSRLT